MKYDFEQLSIDVDGAQVGYFDGTAYLAPDRGGFWITNICLDGPQVTWLQRSGGSTLNTEMFRVIEAAIYASDHARDAFSAFIEGEKADAA